MTAPTPSSSPNPAQAIGMMAKYWTPGKVKTRLAVDTSDQFAANAHRLFVHYLLGRLSDAGTARCLFISPDEFREQMSQHFGQTWEVACQGNGDLGERMASAFRRLLNPADNRKALLIGADLPTLTSLDLAEAFDRLNQVDVVLGPALDGGYYLIGLKGPWTDRYSILFKKMRWSTSNVLGSTLQRVSEAGWTYSLLRPREDIDTLASLHRTLQSETTEKELSEPLRVLLREGDPL